MDLDIRFKKLRIDAVVPAYAHGSAEDAGLDLIYCADHPAAIAPNGRSLLSTGIAIELPSGFEGQIRPRSGIGAFARSDRFECPRDNRSRLSW